MAIEKGTIKVVWITKNTSRIYSKMFGDIKTAVAFGETKKDYVIFRLLWRKKFSEFSWELLPYGKYKLYKAGLNFYHKQKGRGALLEKIFLSASS